PGHGAGCRRHPDEHGTRGGRGAGADGARDAPRSRGRSRRLPGREDATARSGDPVVTCGRDAGLTDTGLAPRRAALGILLTVRRGAPFETALDRGLGGLPEVDRRLAHELAAGVLRHEAQLDSALDPLIPRGLPSVNAKVRDVLRFGAYQLRYLEPLPAHAAVTTAVDLARDAVGDRVTGFVNAVLRRLPREDAGGTPPPRDRDPARLAERWSHPAWLVRRWVDRFGFDDTTALLEWNNQHPPLVAQAARLSLEELRTRFDAAGVRHFPAPWDAGIVLDE